MLLDISEGILQPAKQYLSPNHDVRPVDAEVDLLIIHNISLPPGQFDTEDVHALFMNTLDHDAHPYFNKLCNVRVSSHLVITRVGQIIQYVPFHLRAWHAGVSQFNGRDNCNDFSIGIELIGTDEVDYTQAQYRVLADVTKLLLQAYPKLSKDRVVGHCDVAPGRKTDPGSAFDWIYYFELIE